MHQEREDLDILFRKTRPEAVLEKIRSEDVLLSPKDLFAVEYDNYTYLAYNHNSLLNMPEYSRTEVELRMEALENSMHKMGRSGVFSLLVLYADDVLYFDGNSLTCRLEKVLNWHSIYLRLGQDLFTTAWLAWHNAADSPDKMKFRKMTWPSILKTDDVRLNTILKKGLAENHFHLHGSTQTFALSWSCLMNHPDKIHAFINSKPHFKVNLDYNVASGIVDNVMDWESRVLYAAMIRSLLFECCLGMMDNQHDNEGLEYSFRKFDAFPLVSDVNEHTEMLRRFYGVKFEQPEGVEACLDYANCRHFYQVDEGEPGRLLAGERCFLYQCFRRVFRGMATRMEANLLYLYLLIKSNFRAELVQVNRRYGFQNFADYQDRKNQLYEKNREYWTESLRLSVYAGIAENHLCSLEARIMPGISSSAMSRSITDLDRRIRFSQMGGHHGLDSGLDKPVLPYFYVTHFAKKALSNSEFYKDTLMLKPRNYAVREKIKRQVKALDHYMHLYDNGRQRVWGIDACSMEIGCRPETFSTEIRFLRECSRNIDCSWYRMEEDIHKKIGVTYHVGEDFLDIADGLRAVDEVLLFLCMEKGERIGHGLVLGVDPEEYYQQKRNSIYLRKQDYLDNLVWLLYRSLELGVEIKEYARAYMKNEALGLLNEIYGGTAEENLSIKLYYQSWKLRGDHPDLYINGKFGDRKEELLERDYNNYMIPGGFAQYSTKYGQLDAFRKNDVVAGIYSRYHFDDEVKRRGYEVIGVAVEKWYIGIIKDMQQAMRLEVYKKGICIECNPTSNVLIGTFKKYSSHPILRFNAFNLENDNEHLNIQVSVNTDDLGVFDTSLENEYALLLNAICRQRHELGNYNDDAVYEYLDYLRISGINMAFWRNE